MALPAAIAAFISREGIKKAIKKFGEKAVKEATEEPIKGVTQARQKMMTPAQKSRARKTRQESGLSARRDMKDAKPPIERSEGGSVNSDETRHESLVSESNRYKRYYLEGKVESFKDYTPKENLNRYIQAQKSILRRAKDPETKNRIKKNILKHIDSSTGYDSSFDNLRYSEVGGKIAKSLVPKEMAQKEKSLSKREKEAFPKKKPVEKAKGGLATSRSRKPRGVGVALRGYGKALK